MTTRPRLRLGSHLLPGLIAVALFGVFALAILRSSFGDPVGFPEDASIVANIGFALLDIDAGGVPAEGFLVAFIAIALVLDAALDGAVMLAKREPDEAVETDGGTTVGGGDVADVRGGSVTGASGGSVTGASGGSVTGASDGSVADASDGSVADASGDGGDGGGP